MSVGLLFWILMLIWLFFGYWAFIPWRREFAPSLLLWFLLFLLGVGTFGWPIKG